MRYIILVAIMISNSFIIAQKKYEACCGAEPIEYTYADMSIYVPNVFSPNKDSINNLFFPHLNGNVVEVIDFTIFTGTGDTVLFYRPSIVYTNLENYGWNGLRDGYKEPYIGAFKYMMKIVNKKGDTQLLYGRACRLECSDEADALISNPGCYYPDQAGVNGKLDKTKKTREKKCK